MDTSTLIVVFLLVTAASLASYALSHWSSIRGALGVGWAATSIGTTMLLVAAAVVVLTFVFKGPLWRANLGVEQQMQERAAASEETSARDLGASPLGAANTSKSATASSTTETVRKRRDFDDSPDAPANEPQASKAAPPPSPSKLSSAPSRVFRDSDPSRCVHVYHPGSDPTEWKIDNDCDLPVGIRISKRQMILPAKSQRPVTLAEQTVFGDGSFNACFAATSEAIYLLGAPSEERATDSWREQFEAARMSDGCLAGIQY